MQESKKTSLIIMILLLVVGVTSSYVASTYAKYTSDLGTKEGTATVAKWAFTAENASKTFNVSLDGTYNSDTLVSGKIAPGTSGSFAIELSNVNSEVGVNYELTIGNTINKPTNLLFYANAEHTQPIQNNKITGTLTPGQSSKSLAIYWAWAYETTGGDDADNTAGTNAVTEANANMSIPITITGTQVTPTKTGS